MIHTFRDSTSSSSEFANAFDRDLTMLSIRPSASTGMYEVSFPFLLVDVIQSSPTALCSSAMRLARPHHLGEGPRPWSSRHQEGKLNE